MSSTYVSAAVIPSLSALKYKHVSVIHWLNPSFTNTRCRCSCQRHPSYYKPYRLSTRSSPTSFTLSASSALRSFFVMTSPSKTNRKIPVPSAVVVFSYAFETSPCLAGAPHINALTKINLTPVIVITTADTRKTLTPSFLLPQATSRALPVCFFLYTHMVCKRTAPGLHLMIFHVLLACRAASSSCSATAHSTLSAHLRACR
ncbi:hypothetical protein Plhal304r1_c029g0096711 [Plasmopara halstedii]